MHKGKKSRFVEWKTKKTFQTNEKEKSFAENESERRSLREKEISFIDFVLVIFILISFLLTPPTTTLFHNVDIIVLCLNGSEERVYCWKKVYVKKGKENFKIDAEWKCLLFDNFCARFFGIFQWKLFVRATSTFTHFFPSVLSHSWNCFPF